MKLAAEEIEAMEEKAMSPTKNIRCPRCGEPLRFLGYKTANKVFCPTDGCIRLTLRGI